MVYHPECTSFRGKPAKTRISKAHIFFNCSYAKEVWSLVPLIKAVHIADDDNFEKTVTKFRKAFCLPPTGISGNVLPWICWAIWTARNTLVLEDRNQTSKETATKGLASAKEWNLVQIRSTPIISTAQNAEDTPVVTAGRQQNLSSVTCNTYVACDNERKRAGLAWNFLSSSPSITMEGTLVRDYFDSPLIVEALAVRTAPSKAVELEISDLRLYTDCTTLLGAITRKSQRKEIIGIVSDIRLISTAFASIFFFHVSRSKTLFVIV